MDDLYRSLNDTVEGVGYDIVQVAMVGRAEEIEYQWSWEVVQLLKYIEEQYYCRYSWSRKFKGI
jgi:hypothetical protein